MVQLVAQVVDAFYVWDVKLEVTVQQMFLEIVWSIEPAGLVVALQLGERAQEPRYYLVGSHVTGHVSGDPLRADGTDVKINKG